MLPQISTKHEGICPTGWHIPSDAEWTTLTNFAGGASTAGTKLKSNSSNWEIPVGTDDYGFSALPGGAGTSSGSFDWFETNGDWWSTSEDNSNSAY